MGNSRGRDLSGQKGQDRDRAMATLPRIRLTMRADLETQPLTVVFFNNSSKRAPYRSSSESSLWSALCPASSPGSSLEILQPADTNR
jgi:hypothetical protein